VLDQPADEFEPSTRTASLSQADSSRAEHEFAVEFASRVRERMKSSRARYTESLESTFDKYAEVPTVEDLALWCVKIKARSFAFSRVCSFKSSPCRVTPQKTSFSISSLKTQVPIVSQRLSSANFFQDVSMLKPNLWKLSVDPLQGSDGFRDQVVDRMLPD
jgi:hypothetical protein